MSNVAACCAGNATAQCKPHLKLGAQLLSAHRYTLPIIVIELAVWDKAAVSDVRVLPYVVMPVQNAVWDLWNDFTSCNHTVLTMEGESLLRATTAHRIPIHWGWLESHWG
jgi:hypothetical protein